MGFLANEPILIEVHMGIPFTSRRVLKVLGKDRYLYGYSYGQQSE